MNSYSHILLTFGKNEYVKHSYQVTLLKIIFVIYIQDNSLDFDKKTTSF